jgi:hypothetical protein
MVRLDTRCSMDYILRETRPLKRFVEIVLVVRISIHFLGS